MKNQIKIESISLVNFKGVKNQSISFASEQTDIFGANGTGKTTIFDAFTWLLFGKDSTDRKDFEVKALDLNNRKTDNAEIEVSAVLWVNGTTIEVKRILKENWVKRRGSLEPEFKGNETVYYWDGVPMQQKEYLSKITAILDESVFKLITNPLAFNSLKWQEKRNVLMQITGTLSDIELAGDNADYMALVEKLTNGKTLEDYRKQISASIKKSKDDLKDIPTRIDEVLRTKPETKDFAGLKIQLEGKKNELATIDGQIHDKSKAFDSQLEEINKKKLAANVLKNDIATIEAKAKSDAEEKVKPDDSVLMLMQNTLETKTADLIAAKNGLVTLALKVATIQNEITQTESKISGKRTEWETENAKELSFDDKTFCCPTCNRSIEAEDAELKKTQMISEFKAKKNVALSQITAQGQSLANEKTNLKNELVALDERIRKGEALVDSLNAEIKKATADIETETAKHENAAELPSKEEVYAEIISSDKIYAEKKAELEQVQSAIVEIPKIDIDELKAKRETIIGEMDSIKTELHVESQIRSVEERVGNLRKEEGELAQFIANVEKEQFTIENFNKLKIDSLEGEINSKFSFVKFKLFETQINGGEVECCEALIAGVPFSDANTASKINAGLDIINTLCDFYKVSAPIFIDNRESVVNVIDTDSQIINLIVSKEDKSLRVA